MPIYVYEPTIYDSNEAVQDCCYFEVIQKIGDAPLTECTTCKHKVHRAVASFYVGSKQNSSQRSAAEQGDSASSLQSSFSKNAARLAARHVCGGGCSH